MKLIGLLGGTSWPSTFSYYEFLNRGVAERQGGFHSARIMLYSIDYNAIKSNYHDGWDKIPGLLAEEIKFLLSKGPDCFILCNNTLHRAFDVIKEEIGINIPVFHAGHLAAAESAECGYKTVLLLGTAFTMEDGFFAKYFSNLGIKAIIPEKRDRDDIQKMQSQIAAGNNRPEFRAALGDMLKKYPDVDAVILACTELPLAIDEGNCSKPLVDPVRLQCKAAIKFVTQA